MNIFLTSPISFPGLGIEGIDPPDGFCIPGTNFEIKFYGVIIAIGVLLAVTYCLRRAKQFGVTQDDILNLVLICLPSAIVGARLYYVIFEWDQFFGPGIPWYRFLDIRSGGLAIYGGVIGGLIAAKLVSRKHKISMLTLLDVVAPALVLGQGIGRWGNYINMEAYGLRIAEESLQFFPFAVEIPVGDVWYWHMATFFYEFCWDMLVFVLLMAIRKHRRRGGDVFCWYLLLYCSGRTVIEGLRNDSLTFISEFVRISQILSAVAALSVVIYFFLRIRDRISVVTIAPLVSAVLCIVVTFLGEFERGAYSFLFTFSQIGLAALLISQIAIIILWTADSGRFDLRVAAPLLADGLFLVGLLIAGLGRANEDNTYYVTLRQCAAMIQLILCGWLLCYPLYPKVSESEID